MIPRRLPGVGLHLRRVAVEPRPDELLWAESVWTPRGRRLLGCGRVSRPADEKAEAFLGKLARTSWLRHAEVAIPIRHPELTLERLALPPLSNRDAARVADRRASEVVRSSPEEANGGYLLAAPGDGRVAWLASCPAEFAGFVERRWRQQGLPVSSFAHSHLALGALTHALEAPGEGELHAFLDVGVDHAICVVADAQGWTFSREIPIKITRVRSNAEEGADPLERLATELRRTFQYVESELRQGFVARLVLSGTREDIAELSDELAARLDIRVALIGDAAVEGPAAAVEPALGMVVGLALEPATGNANLLPPNAIREVARRRTRRLLAAATAVPALIVLLASIHLIVNLDGLSQQAVDLEAEWEASELERAEAELLARERAGADEVASAREAMASAHPGWTGALHSLGLLLPGDAFTSVLRGEHGDLGWAATLDLEFRGDDLASAAEEGSRFAERLDQSPIWSVRGVSRDAGSTIAHPAESSSVRSHIRVDALLAPIVPGQESPIKGADHG